MIFIDRDRVKDSDIAAGVSSFEDISTVDKPWWMPKNWLETFPKGWVPLAFLKGKESAYGIDDADLRLMPKSGSWVKYPVPGFYVLARAEKYTAMKEKYKAFKSKGWLFTEWDLSQLFGG